MVKKEGPSDYVVPSCSDDDSRSLDPETVRRFVSMIVRHWEEWLRLVRRAMPSRLRSTMDAEDIVQDACLVALTTLPRVVLDSTSDLRAWFRKVLWNTLRNVIRKHSAAKRGDSQARFVRFRVTIEQFEFPRLNPEKLASLGEDVERVLLALESVSPRSRMLFELVYVEEVPLNEAASIVGMLPGAAAIELWRTRKRIREMLEE